MPERRRRRILEESVRRSIASLLACTPGLPIESAIRVVFRFVVWLAADGREWLTSEESEPLRRWIGDGPFEGTLFLDLVGEKIGAPERGRDLVSGIDAECLAEAMRALLDPRVDYRVVGGADLGAIYEKLIDCRLGSIEGRAALVPSAHQERRRRGTYYTPDALVERLLESALEPVIEQVRREGRSLREIKVLDPAVGSGRFLLAAGRRLASAFAKELGVDEATAWVEMVGACLYGVDIDPMALELCRATLWLDGPSRSRLELPRSRLVHGDALIGSVPDPERVGFTDAAFQANPGDDRMVLRRLRKRNKAEQPAGESLFAPEGTDRDWIADAWCAAHLIPRQDEGLGITTGTLVRLSEGEPVSEAVRVEVERAKVRYRFVHPHLVFREVFERDRGGFDVVLANPPWERGGSEGGEGGKIEPEERARFLRRCGRFPLTGKGEVNLYAPFAELAWNLLRPGGRAGMIVPTGIATDDGPRRFFGALVESGSLISLFDFENGQPNLDEEGVRRRGRGLGNTRRRLFPEVHSSFRFCLITFTGEKKGRETDGGVEFAVGLHRVEDLDLPGRVYRLSADDIALMNPNTRTCPLLRDQADLEIARGIYRRVPVFVRKEETHSESWETGLGERLGDPWRIRLQRMFDMTHDARRFLDAARLRTTGAARIGNQWMVPSGHPEIQAGEWIPLLEAKMVHLFDHRWATFDGGQIRESRSDEKASPEFEAMPRYWVHHSAVDQQLPVGTGWMIGYRNICRSSDIRTAIFSIVPRAAAGHSLPLLHTTVAPMMRAALVANLSSMVFDYLVRQKLGGTNFTFGYLEQIPVLPPSTYWNPCPWSDETMLNWVLPRVLTLAYTSHDLAAFASDLGYFGPPAPWDEAERFRMKVDLEAAFLRLYGVSLKEADTILDSFPIVREQERSVYGAYLTKEAVLERLAQMMERR